MSIDGHHNNKGRNKNPQVNMEDSEVIDSI